MSSHRSYILLTGATGLLGRSLLRDLAAVGRRVAVLVRPGKTTSAVARVDEILDDWAEVAGADVACPVVLSGDITASGLGLSREQKAWAAANVDEVVHSAASLSFQMRADGEPWNSNVHGTANVLEFCRLAGVRRYHHVSSAYVCGLRQGRILETELDVGQTPGNDYERSKIVSEKAAVESPFFDACTVHRPSIIVGDLVAGFTNTFHGFYKPLRIVQPFVEAFVGAALESGSLLDVLGMTGAERKNLVPVDWVSAVMTRIIQDRSLHGATYHLTSTAPTPVGDLCRIFEGIAVEMAEQEREQGGPTKPPAAFDPATLGRLFSDQMHVYRAYWKDDPEFDSSATMRVAPDLPSPHLDDETIRRLCRFAIDTKFRWPPIARRASEPRGRQLLESALGAAQWGPHHTGPAVGLAVAGAGGGQWTIVCDDIFPTALHIGLPDQSFPVVWTSAAALETLLNGEPAQVWLGRGAGSIEAAEESDREFALGVLGRLVSGCAANGAHEPQFPVALKAR
jgi:thioester reductase-like protein